jgi:hypothetical protein
MLYSQKLNVVLYRDFVAFSFLEGKLFCEETHVATRAIGGQIITDPVISELSVPVIVRARRNVCPGCPERVVILVMTISQVKM